MLSTDAMRTTLRIFLDRLIALSEPLLVTTDIVNDQRRYRVDAWPEVMIVDVRSLQDGCDGEMVQQEEDRLTITVSNGTATYKTLPGRTADELICVKEDPDDGQE